MQSYRIKIYRNSSIIDTCLYLRTRKPSDFVMILHYQYKASFLDHKVSFLDLMFKLKMDFIRYTKDLKIHLILFSICYTFNALARN